MHVIYDVSHNVAKIEEHMVDGKLMSLLLHRKGSTRAFPPLHPLIPVDYQFIGQPVLIGGSMGTCSYVLTGTEKVCVLDHHQFALYDGGRRPGGAQRANLRPRGGPEGI